MSHPRDSELKPCPFCGGKPEMYQQTIEPEWETCMVICADCPAKTCSGGYTVEESIDNAIELWNRRHVETCRYLPDSSSNWWDAEDVEWTCDEAEDPYNGGDCSCDKCGYTMMGGEDGWFDFEPLKTPDNVRVPGCVPVPRFEHCPNCGRKVERLVPKVRKVGER